MSVYRAINKVSEALARMGIAKNKRNKQGEGYNFRGIDDVYNALAPLLAEHGLCILPRMLDRDCVERTSKSGGALFYTTVIAEFDFVSSEDGSKHTVRTYGEAMDSGDKSTNKAMSAAYKYAAFQAFCIPTEAEDSDAQTHEVQPVKPPFKHDVKILKAIAEAKTMDELSAAWNAIDVSLRGHYKDAKDAAKEAIAHA